MLDQPINRKQLAARNRNRKHRDRVRRGLLVIPVEVDSKILDLLVRHRWMREADSHDIGAIGAAIKGLLMLSARCGEGLQARDG
jgi:hypothetical protein